MAKSDYLVNNIEMSIRGLKYGMSGPIVVNGGEYDGIMQDQGLDDDEIADVMNYILNNWGNEYWYDWNFNWWWNLYWKFLGCR